MFPKLFFISILSSLIFIPSYNSHCLDHQKSLLLQLKNELIFNSSIATKLVQWNKREDCCMWHGVECDVAGYVISLQLNEEAISGGIGDSSSLFRLKYLEKLNLAYNKFNSTRIPRGIHNLTYLTHLNLSSAGFDGQVPAEISSLRRLASLDISNDDFSYGTLKLKHPNLEMLLQNLTGLRELYLDRVNISSFDERRKWSHIISSYLTHLTTLSLSSCGLSGPLAKSFGQLHSLSILRLDDNDLSTVVPDLVANFSNLTTLSLVGCGLKGSFPKMVFHIPTLQNLDLSWNTELSGSIPPFTQIGSLKSIRLSYTDFSGSIPSSISNLKSLSEIDLSNCQFTGSIPSTFANLTQLIRVDLSHNFFTGSLSPTLFDGLSNLVSVHLEYNSLSGDIPHSLFGLPSLLEIFLNNNQFSGVVEEFPILNVSKIESLDLSHNRLEGPIPDSFFQLQSLYQLLLFENLFNGTFQLDKIQTSIDLEELDLSGNNLSVVSNDNSSTYRFPPLLVELNLASCNIYEFPDALKHSDYMFNLNLSNNRIGEIPSWIWGIHLVRLDLSFNRLTHLNHIPPSLQYVNLHSNQLRGELRQLIPPNITYDIWILLLGNNSLSGSIPSSLCSITDLSILDLSDNKLSGSIPSCLLNDAFLLKVLNLGRNNISGRIPDNNRFNCGLEYLDLNSNTLEGKIPKSLENCYDLTFMNVGNNFINDSFPCMLPSSLSVLVLRSNRFHGEVRCHNSWPNLQIVDISSNSFSGSLELTNFSNWTTMVLGIIGNESYISSSNHPRLAIDYWVGVRLIMKGNEVELVKIWQDFNAIDFSCNNFRGVIQNAIVDLRSLHLLNFSHNALNGSIPKSFGQLRKLESLDLSQNQLTGVIPMDLAELTFLQVLNLSYNNLVGEIPNGRQLQTFSADSFKGNPRLCGFNLNISCTSPSDLSPPEHEDEDVEEKGEIEWEYVSAALGYVVGLGIIVWLLLFCRSFRQKYFGKIEEVVEEIFDARDRRRRRRRARTRAVKNRVRRQ